MVARLRKQRVGLNRGLPRIWGLYAWRLAVQAWIWGGEREGEGLKVMVDPAGEAPGDRDEGCSVLMTSGGRAIVFEER